jgi:hypothetical protein
MDREELEYCIDLIRSKGNASVPQKMVCDYLHVQAVGARVSGDVFSAAAYTDAVGALAFGMPNDAIAILLERLAAVE